MIKQFWQSISNIGIKPDYSENKIRRLRLINQYTAIAALLFVINGLSDILLGYTKQGLVLEFSAFILVLALLLNRAHLHRVTLIFLFVFVAFNIFYIGLSTNMMSGDYLYYFPLVLAISFTYDFTKDKWTMIFLFVFIIVLVLINTLTYSEYPITIDVSARSYQRFIINLTLSALTLGFFIYITAKNNSFINRFYEQRFIETEENEAKIKKALTEKEVLLAELHHRVKNNLAVMAGFFSLKLNNTNNPEAKEILLESRNRVNSMALIHNHLYRKADFSEVNFTTFITDLIQEIKSSYPTLSKSIIVHCNIAQISLNLNAAIPCALILNELLTNCYKHAFKNRDRGTISIDFLTLKNGDLCLCVKDDGNGLDVDFKNRDSMGLSVIDGLTKQLNGKNNYTSTSGTSFELIFHPSLV